MSQMGMGCIAREVRHTTDSWMGGRAYRVQKCDRTCRRHRSVLLRLRRIESALGDGHATDGPGRRPTVELVSTGRAGRQHGQDPQQ